MCCGAGRIQVYQHCKRALKNPILGRAHGIIHIEYTPKRVVNLWRKRVMTENQFDVCAHLIRSRKGVAHKAARLVLVDGLNAEQARIMLSNSDLTDQQISNAVRRYERAHSLILTAYSCR